MANYQISDCSRSPWRWWGGRQGRLWIYMWRWLRMKQPGPLPSSDEEEEGEDDQQREASYRCCDNHQHLTLISHIRIWGEWKHWKGRVYVWYFLCILFCSSVWGRAVQSILVHISKLPPVRNQRTDTFFFFFFLTQTPEHEAVPLATNDWKWMQSTNWPSVINLFPCCL